MKQKEKGKSMLDNRPGEDEYVTLFYNMDNFLCPMCQLVRFCNHTCLRTNIDRVNCHPCSAFLKTKYFISPVGAESVETPVVSNQQTNKTIAIDDLMHILSTYFLLEYLWMYFSADYTDNKFFKFCLSTFQFDIQQAQHKAQQARQKLKLWLSNKDS